MKNIILPMLTLQQKHTAAVEKLLNEMFVIEKGNLRFSNTIANGGIKAVNEFGRKAHILLRNYYLESEAYFIRGVLIFEKPEYKAFFDSVV